MKVKPQAVGPRMHDIHIEVELQQNNIGIMQISKRSLDSLSLFNAHFGL